MAFSSEDINGLKENPVDRIYWFDGKVNPCDADYKSYLSLKLKLKHFRHMEFVRKSINYVMIILQQR